MSEKRLERYQARQIRVVARACNVSNLLVLPFERSLQHSSDLCRDSALPTDRPSAINILENGPGCHSAPAFVE